MYERAVVLAGGQGTRLRPFTVVLPKPLMPVGDYPVLEIIVRQLTAAGVRRITLAVNHQASLIRAFFGDGSPWGVAIDYSIEAAPLSTIAPLRLIPDLPDRFLLMNGDVLTDLDYGELCRAHKRAGGVFTIAAATRRHTVDYGVLQVGDGWLTGFSEKPSVEYHVSMGVYVMNLDVLADVPADRPYGFDHLMTDLLRRGARVHVHSYDGYWLDIGRPDDHQQAIREFDEMRARLLPS